MNFVSRKWLEEKLFSQNQSINVIYSKVDNQFIVPNHENKGDHYVNEYLAQLINEP